MAPALKATADELLAEVVASLATEGRPAFLRSYVSDGAVAYDCEQLVVEVEGVFAGLPLAGTVSPLDNRTVLHVNIAIHAVRCAPALGSNGSAPSAAAIDASAAAVLGDAAAQLAAVRTFSSRCRPAVLSGSSFPGPLGGFVAAVTRVAVAL